MGRNPKPKRELTEKELDTLEALSALDMSEDAIAILTAGLSYEWFRILEKKKNSSVRYRKRLGKAKAEYKAKSQFWKKIEQGDLRAIMAWMKHKGFLKTAPIEVDSETIVNVNSVVTDDSNDSRVVVYIPQNGSESEK